MMEWKVSAEESGMRLLPFLKSRIVADVSIRQLKRSVESGRCQVNGRTERFASQQIGTGDRITFHVLEKTLERPPLHLTDQSSRFLYLDHYLTIYNKMAGIDSDDEVLLSRVQKLLPQAQLIHRLDRDTTGALVFAQSQKVCERMADLFKKRKVKKTYLAIVDGRPKRLSGILENYLGKHSTYQGQALWGPVDANKGLRARTEWHVAQTGNHAALLYCYPETGRTHQIRVHLSGMGHPILGDFQYGRAFCCPFRPHRMLLHAAEISFEHPVTQELVDVKAPLPSDFEEAIRILMENVVPSIDTKKR